MKRKSRAKPPSPFRRFNSSPEVIRLAVMMYIRFPLSLRIVEDVLFEHGIDICHETVRFWWNRFGPTFAADIRQQRISRTKGLRHWRWHLDEVFVKINGERHCLWRAVDPEGEVLESFVTKKREKSHWTTRGEVCQSETCCHQTDRSLPRRSVRPWYRFCARQRQGLGRFREAARGATALRNPKSTMHL